MRDRQKSKNAKKLRDLKSLQKSADQLALADEQARVTARLRDNRSASRNVDDAFDVWMSSFNDHATLDPARADLAARMLARCEQQLTAAVNLYEQAVELADRKRQRLAESTTQLMQAEDIVRTLDRRISRHVEEQRQARLEERIAFEWFRHV